MSLPASAAFAPRPKQGWVTSTLADDADTHPGELDALGRHVDRCLGSHGRLFRLRCAADSVRAFVAPRRITLLVAVGLVAVTASSFLI